MAQKIAMRPWFFMLSGFVLFSAYLKNPKEETMIQHLGSCCWSANLPLFFQLGQDLRPFEPVRAISIIARKDDIEHNDRDENDTGNNNGITLYICISLAHGFFWAAQVRHEEEHYHLPPICLLSHPSGSSSVDPWEPNDLGTRRFGSSLDNYVCSKINQVLTIINYWLSAKNEFFGYVFGRYPLVI